MSWRETRSRSHCLLLPAAARSPGDEAEVAALMRQAADDLIAIAGAAAEIAC